MRPPRRIGLARVAAALAVAAFAASADVRAAAALLGWDALRPAAAEAPPADPFATLTDAQFEALGGIVRFRALAAQGLRPSEAARLQHDDAVRGLLAQGLDVEGLLAQRARVIAQRRLDAARAVPAIDGARVRLAGYLVPVGATAGGAADFLLLARPGACSHVAPPPANQVLRVRARALAPVAEPYAPAFVEGTLRVRAGQARVHLVDGEVTIDAAYAMDDAAVERPN